MTRRLWRRYLAQPIRTRTLLAAIVVTIFVVLGVLSYVLAVVVSRGDTSDVVPGTTSSTSTTSSIVGSTTIATVIGSPGPVGPRGPAGPSGTSAGTTTSTSSSSTTSTTSTTTCFVQVDGVCVHD